MKTKPKLKVIVYIAIVALTITTTSCKQEEKFDYNKYLEPPSTQARDTNTNDTSSEIVDILQEDDSSSRHDKNKEQVEDFILAFVQAEDSKQIGDILAFYSFPVDRYYTSYDLDREALSKKYTSVWDNLTSSSNKIRSIEQVSENHYRFLTDFEARTKKGKHIEKSSYVHIHLENGLISKVYN